ncbi:MAG: hypothetical protein MZU97_05400 [Bacillus subtilis]|nr:hypothetical protein [Bacillus subtilis]
MLDTAAITCAAVLTYWLQGYMNVVLASAAIGLIGAMTIKDHESELFLGSFIGMASAALFPVYAIAAAGMLGGLIYPWLKPWLHHAGGKLGFLAFVSVLLVSTLSSAFAVFDWEWRRTARSCFSWSHCSRLFSCR